MKNHLITIGVIVLVALGLYAFNSKTTDFTSGGSDLSGTRVLNVGGVVKEFRYNGFATGTTTVWAVQSPRYATSTLSTSGNCTFRTSSTTASTVTVAKATTAFATTTLIRTESVGANAQSTFLVASTSVSSLADTNRTFAPGDWLVVGMAGGTGTFSPVGSCSVEFTVAR